MLKCKKTEILEKVLEHVRNDNESFVLYADGYHYHFMQERVGTGKYLYGCCEHEDLHPLYSLELNFSLAAIYVDGLQWVEDRLYIIKDYLFGIDDKDTLPNNVCYFGKEYKCDMEKAMESMMAEFYESLDTVEVNEENVKARARKLAMQGEKQDSLSLYCPDFIMTTEDFAGSLCGLAGFREAAYKRFQKKKSVHMRRKSEIEAVNKLLSTTEELMDTWEFALAKVLNEYKNAKFLTVEFTVNGRTAKGKISPLNLQSALNGTDGLNCYSFDNLLHGNRVFEELREPLNSRLPCRNISKITYGKETLYERKGENAQPEKKEESSMLKCKKTEILRKVLEHVRNGNESFVLYAEGYHYHFMQERVGVGKYLYGCCEHEDLHPLYSLELNFSLAAIYVDDLQCVEDRLYVISDYLCGIGHGDKLPNNVCFFDKEYKYDMEKAIEPMMTEFYENLDTVEVNKENAKARARELAVKGEKQDSLSLYCPDYVMTMEDFAGNLCCLVGFREAAYKRFQKKEGVHMRRKSEIEAVNKLLSAPEELMDTWEFALAKVLSEYKDAKFLTVEFTVNGRTAKGKISPLNLQSALNGTDGLNCYSFDTFLHGNRVFEELREPLNSWLLCRDISKITYGRETLYERENYAEDHAGQNL